MAAQHIYHVQNSAAPTTAASVKQPLGSTALRTMLQIASLSTRGLQIVEWGISFDGSAAATSYAVELFGTTVAATMSTALANADVTNFTDENGPTADTLMQFSTTTTAFATGAVTEGTVANCRRFDNQLVAPTSQYVKQWPLGTGPMIDLSQFIRIRVTTPAASAVSCYCYCDVAAL